MKPTWIERADQSIKDAESRLSIDHAPMFNGAAPAGYKADAGKNQLSLVILSMARALEAVGQVGTFGANKYSADGWVKVENGQKRYTDALLRHLLADGRGEELDSESGLPHLAHAAWCALAILDLKLREQHAKTP